MKRSDENKTKRLPQITTLIRKNTDNDSKCPKLLTYAIYKRKEAMGWLQIPCFQQNL